MKRLILLLSISVFFLSCERKHYSLQSISQEEFQKLQATEKGIQLIDARTQAEFDQGAIDGAVLIDVLEGDFAQKTKELFYSDRPVYIYCKRGSRSVNAGTELLLDKEFTEVYYLEGGYIQWKQNQEK